jgi:hypothetical protein
MNLHPPIFRHMIQIINTPRHGIAMTRVINGALAQINGLFDGKIGSVVGV